MEQIMKNLNYQPANLSADELANPADLMTSYFMDQPLHKSRSVLWDLFKAWLIRSSEFADEELINDRLSWYTQTIEYLNASYVQTEKMKADSCD